MGGRLKYFRGNWERITGDPWILDTVAGAKVEFLSRSMQGDIAEKVQMRKSNDTGSKRAGTANRP